jgi:glycosyltransferase XagB
MMTLWHGEMRAGHRPATTVHALGLAEEHTADRRLTFAQAVFLYGGALLLGGMAFLSEAPLDLIGHAVSPICLLACFVHLAAVIEKREPLPQACEPQVWPHYTILVPLYREARVVPQLLAALRALSYPRDRLEVILLVEQDDQETAVALAQACLQRHERLLRVPDGHPRTKPRALNHGLIAARPGLIVVYDAEDIPDTDQLRKAALTFLAAPADVVCLQARLDIDNGTDSLLSALFRLEYLAQFHAVKPGLAADGMAVPLGGTSNHFRREALMALGGWDPWNVTEDADLGLRIARSGYRVGDLVSRTREEAPVYFGQWLRQRRRWMKGWLQTVLVHSRDPARTWRELGAARTLCALGTVAGPFVSAIVYPIFSLRFLMDVADGAMFWSDGVIDAGLKSLNWVVFALGMVTMTLPVMVGAFRAERAASPLLLALMPLYMGLISLATVLAIVDFIHRPFHWWKTEHGLATRRGGSETGHDGIEQGAGEDGLTEAGPEDGGKRKKHG